MNTTGRYIGDLLYRYECVILPGFGAFLTKRQGASVQESTHAFFPPQKSISFNSQLQNNDGLLANYIAAVEHISYTDAVAKIQRYVLSLHNKMALGQQVIIDNIGSFYTSVEDTLQFESTQEVNYLTEAFGLSSFISPSIIRETSIQEPQVMVEKTHRETYKEQVVTLEEKTPIAFTPEKRKERPYLKYAAIAIIGLGIAGFLGLQQINTQTGLHNESVSHKVDQQLHSKIQEATFEITSPLPAINITTVKKVAANDNIYSTASTNKKYHIVAGAFRIKSNANKKVKKLIATGYDARLIKANKYGLHQVVFVSHTNRTAALQSLKEIKKQGNPRAWLLIEK